MVRAYTLIELVVALAVSTMLIGALGSAVVIAASALPADDRSARVLDTTDSLAQLASDLEQAMYATAPSSQELRVVVPTRDGDGAPDVIRYGWSGKSGDPVTRTLNSTPATSVIEDVTGFGVRLEIIDVEETFSDPGQEVQAQVAKNDDLSVNMQWLGLSFRHIVASKFDLALPSGCVSWRPTSIDLYAATYGTVDCQFEVEIRPLDKEGHPLDVVLSGTSVLETSVPEPSAWMTIPVTDDRWIDAAGDYALTLGMSSDTGTAVLLLQDGAGGRGTIRGDANQRYWTEGTGWPKSWVDHLGNELYYRIRADCLIVSPNGTVSWKKVVLGNISVETEFTSLSRMARVVNAPFAVTTLWDADFSSDPSALDLNADTVADWGALDGSFNTAQLSSGVWSVGERLFANPDTDVVSPTIVELQWRATDVGQVGGIFLLTVDQGPSQHAVVALQIDRVSADKQRVRVYEVEESGAGIELGRIETARLGFLETRLLVVPDSDLLRLTVDGVSAGTFRYQLRNKAAGISTMDLYNIGTGAEVDRVRVLMGAGS